MVVARNAGYIVYKDSKIVIFYTNDLAQTPSKPILYSTDAEAVTCVHGLAKLKRWTKKDIYHRTKYMVPSIIVAYNIFMNSVDRFDQYRQTYITQRRERRVTMSIFTFLLDASIYNAYAIYQQLYISEQRSKAMEMKEFRRILITQLVGNVTRKSKQTTNTVSSTIPITTEKHILLTSKNKKQRYCQLCRIMENTQTIKRKRRTKYSCQQCKTAFCVDCFSAYHNMDDLKQYRPDIEQKIKDYEEEKEQKKARYKPITCMSTFQDVKFNFDL